MFFNEAGIPIEKKNILVCSGICGIKFLRPKLYEVNLQGPMSEEVVGNVVMNPIISLLA